MRTIFLLLVSLPLFGQGLFFGLNNPPAGGGGGTPALVSGQFATGFATSSPVTATLPSTPTVGNTIVGVCFKQGNTGGYSATDNQSSPNTYTVGGTGEYSAETIRGWNIVAPIVTASGAFTVTCASSTFVDSYIMVAIAEFTTLTATPIDKNAAGFGASTGSHDSGNTAATSQASELVIGGMYFFSASAATLSPGSGFTLVTENHANASNGFGMQYKVVSSTGAQSATFTDNQGAGKWMSTVQTYKGQ